MVAFKHILSEKVQAGFTLLEALITMVIVSVSLLAMAQLLIVTIQQNSNSEIRMDASAAVHTVLEEISASVVANGDCSGVAATAATRAYLQADYQAAMSCMESPTGSMRFFIGATITGPKGNVVAKANSMITTAVSTQ